MSKTYAVNADLIRAIIYMESTHGWYDAPLTVMTAGGCSRRSCVCCPAGGVRCPGEIGAQAVGPLSDQQHREVDAHAHGPRGVVRTIGRAAGPARSIPLILLPPGV